MIDTQFLESDNKSEGKAFDKWLMVIYMRFFKTRECFHCVNGFDSRGRERESVPRLSHACVAIQALAAKHQQYDQPQHQGVCTRCNMMSTNDRVFSYVLAFRLVNELISKAKDYLLACKHPAHSNYNIEVARCLLATRVFYHSPARCNKTSARKMPTSRGVLSAS